MSAGGTALVALGIVLLIAGLALIGLDYLGKGDTSGLDYKDIAILAVGFVLAGVGAAVMRRTPPHDSEKGPAPASTPPPQ